MRTDDRPDPYSGKQADESYALKYANYHRTAGDSLECKVWDIDLLIADALFKDYTLLDVGCATAGHLRLIKNHRHVVGIDFAEKTLDEARKLQAEFGVERVEFFASMYEVYSAPMQFDVVRLRGTFGSYRPWPCHLDVMPKTRELLRDEGVVIASFFEPKNWLHSLKAKLFPKATLGISPRSFAKLWASAGFMLLFSIRLPHATVAFLKKQNGAQ